MEPLVRYGVRAMATRFEVALWGGEESWLLRAAQEALREVQSIERRLSFYLESSDISDLNARAALEPVRIDPRLFDLLQRAQMVWRYTDGSFDCTVAALMRAWGLQGAGHGHVPDAATIAEAIAATGMQHLALDAGSCSVTFAVPGLMLDLGAIGKGYAIDQAVEVLQDLGVGGALVHGGTSTSRAIGPGPDGNPWAVAIQDPQNPVAHLAVVRLNGDSLSVSAVHGKFFTENDAKYGHVLDPRSGRPVHHAVLAAVRFPGAAESDALSTALMVLGADGLDVIGRAYPGATGLVAVPDCAGGVVVSSTLNDV